MIEQNINTRLQRIHVAIGLATEQGISELPMVPTGPVHGSQGFSRDFSGQMPQEEMIVLIETVVHRIASFRDPCISWFRNHGLDKQLVFDCIDSSRELGIIIDLDNYLKHGEERRGQETNSGLYPRLSNVRRTLQINMNKGDTDVGVAANLTKMRVVGDASLVLSADVVSKTGDTLGIIPDIQSKAVEAWESLLRTHKFIV